LQSIRGGDIDTALKMFVDAIDGDGAWARLPAAAKQQLRDNIFTLLGQAGENRKPFTKAQAESIRTPTLFIGGGNTTGSLATIHRVLAQHFASSQTGMIDGAKHWMFDEAPQKYCDAVPGLGEISHFGEAFDVGAAGFDHHHVAQRIDEGRLSRLGGGAQFFIGSRDGR
jgi:pimeloyl-ACP methyl ester carboxylesterase